MASPASSAARRIWTAIDVVALLGSAGGALAALLGAVPAAYALALPLVLPVVSLVAALQREELLSNDSRAYLARLGASLQGESGALLREARAAVADLRRELLGATAASASARGGAAGPGGGAPPLPLGPRLAALEAKLGVLEGALLGAARESREASAAVGTLQERLSRDARAGQEAVVGAVKGELRRAVSALASEESAAIARLDARLSVSVNTGRGGPAGPGG